MELVDIIDQNDQVIGTVDKAEAHTKGLLHRTVIAEVIGSDGRWTLVKQASDRQDAGQYVSPIGGHVTSGETAEQALKREAHEEYGLSEDFGYKCIGKKVFNREINGKKENHLFIVFEIYTDTEPKLNDESVGTQSFTPRQLKEVIEKNPTIFGDAFHFVIEHFYQSLNTVQ